MVNRCSYCFLFFLVFLLTIPSCSLLRKDRAIQPVFSEAKEENVYSEMISQEHLAKQLWQGLCYGIIEDHFSPPVASRILAYAFVAQYESLVALEATKTSLLFDLQAEGAARDELSLGAKQWISMLTFLQVGEALLYRPKTLDQHRKLLYDHLPQDLLLQIAEELASGFTQQILAIAAQDNYLETRSLPLFVPAKSKNSWEPTPPTYGQAIEPYWGRIRPFWFDSLSLQSFVLPAPFESAEGLHQARDSVYSVRLKLGEDYLAKAEHWDCNPRQTLSSGHMMAVIKQNNPSGHWVGIAIHVMDSLSYSLSSQAHILALMTSAIYDGFIACWRTKYETNVIRPETLINQELDRSWRPTIETPLFPEYTSGHSVTSTIASVILTEYVGDSIAYIDKVNSPLGLPSRTYSSFTEASQEAALSRFYSGIHFLPAVLDGIDQGERIAQAILKKHRQDD